MKAVASICNKNTILSCYNKIPYKILILWIIVIVCFYNWFVEEPEVSNYDIAIPTNQMINAVVFIAMSSLSSDPMVDSSIASVRKNGLWEGDIFIITDHPNCFSKTAEKFKIKTVEVPKTDDIIQIKALKAKLFDYLPLSVQGILYLDVDIVIKQDLQDFLRDMSEMIIKNDIPLRTAKLSLKSTPLHLRLINVKNNSLVADMYSSPSSKFDFAAFPDAKGHFVGFCSGCEKWHTGIMYFRRGMGTGCLEAWHKILLSGKYGTDQQSLDEAELLGYCPNAHFLPKKHLLFAKDYIAMIFTSGQTFIHMTSAGRLATQDLFYRNIVVPRLRTISPSLNEGDLPAASWSDSNSKNGYPDIEDYIVNGAKICSTV